MNEEQIERWNGDRARRWLAERARHAAVRQRLTPHLLRAAAVTDGDRVLDVGCGCGETTAVLAYTMATTQIRDLFAAIPDDKLSARILATAAREFAARECPDGVWVEAAAYLVTGS